MVLKRRRSGVFKLAEVAVRRKKSQTHALRQALKGQDAVISSLGTPPSLFKHVTLLSTATRALVNAMNAEGISRLIAITGIGAGDSAGHGGLAFDHLLLPLFLRHVYADKNRQEAIIRESDLNWTIVRPAILNNTPQKGTTRALEDLSKFRGGTIARADVARFIVDELETGRWVGKLPLIAW